MTNNLPAIKVYDIDYEFILKNYLDPALWERKWVLLNYKGYEFTIRLNTIYVNNNKVEFYLRLDMGNNYEYTYIDYSLKTNDIKLLKKRIESKCLELLERAEEHEIKGTDDYSTVYNIYQREDDELRRVAEEFLNDNNVTNETIREAYIDVFVDNNKKMDYHLRQYLDSKKYTYLTDFYVLFAHLTDNKYLASKVLDKIDSDKVRQVLDEIYEILKQLDDESYAENVSNYLEDI